MSLDASDASWPSWLNTASFTRFYASLALSGQLALLRRPQLFELLRLGSQRPWWLPRGGLRPCQDASEVDPSPLPWLAVKTASALSQGIRVELIIDCKQRQGFYALWRFFAIFCSGSISVSG